MNRFPRRVASALALIIGPLGPQSTLARVIDRYHFAPASATTNVSTPAPNNDNATSASLNQINFLPSYPGAHFNSLAFSDSVFLVHASGGSTEYYLTEAVFK